MLTNDFENHVPTAADMTDNHIFVDRLYANKAPYAGIAELDAMIQTARDMDADKVDFSERVSGLRLDDGFNLVVPSSMGDVAPMRINDRAVTQLYKKMAPIFYGEGTKRTLPADFMGILGGDERAAIINRRMAGLDDKKWMVRTYQGRVRAILAQDWTDIRNTQLLEIVQTAIQQNPTGDLALVRPHLTPDSLNLRVLYKNYGGTDPETGNPRWGIGAIISNGEIGDQKCNVWPILQKGPCTNTTVFKVEGGVSFIHRGSLQAKVNAIMEAIGHSFDLAAEGLQRLTASYQRPIERFEDVLAGLGREYGWSQEVATAVTLGTKGNRSVGGLVDGVTEAGWRLFDGNAQTDMESLGGALLAAPDSLFASAARLNQNALLRMAESGERQEVRQANYR